MIPLLNAIYAKFAADTALRSAFPGGMHRDRAPEGTAMPYIVSTVVHVRTEPSYGGSSIIDVRIRFSGYGIGHDAAGSLMETFVSRFDNALLTLSSGTNESVVRIDEPTPVLHRHDASGNDVWQWSVNYDYGAIA